MIALSKYRPSSGWILLAALILTALVYWPGLSGAFLFDDYPNIVDNHSLQPKGASLPSLIGAALSSPSSEFKRPLASLSFGLNYLASGLDPYWMKLTNLVIHLGNGVLVFLLARLLLLAVRDRTQAEPAGQRIVSPDIVAALIAFGWLLLPINLTSVLYVVQRMESLANLFVLAGLVGYTAGRRKMFATGSHAGITACAISLIVPAVLGLLAKETAVLLPLYALLIECALFGFHDCRVSTSRVGDQQPADQGRSHARDGRIIALFICILFVPLALGSAWLLPRFLRPESWASRDFTLTTRLFSEIRIVADYVIWTLLPQPQNLSFYHDDFVTSTSLVVPWTTAASLLALVSMFVLALRLRRRYPLVFLGVMLFFACHSLTATVLPLELVYEHRNYFASLGLLLALIPVLVAPSGPKPSANPSIALPRLVALASLILWWAGLTAMTAQAWGAPLRLAEELASRAPDSPRAQYELGRTYIIYSHYDPNSPFTKLAYAPLERAASLPNSSILPQQALIFMNARMGLPIEDTWWTSMIAKLAARKPGVQDESSLSALTQCVREARCNLSRSRMSQAFSAALSHGRSSARLLATFSDYAWNVLGDRALGEEMIRKAIVTEDHEPAYLVTLARMLIAEDRKPEAQEIILKLEKLNMGGQLNDTVAELSDSLIAH